MLNRIMIGLCFAVLCVSVPLTLKLQPKVIERTVERNIIVDSSVKGELEQKINQWVKETLEREVEKMTPQMQTYYRQKIEESWKKKEKQFSGYVNELRFHATKVLEKFTDDLERRQP